MIKHITTIKTWFNRPFPFSETPGSKIRTSALFGLFIFLFLAFFQPFNIASISQYKYLYLSGFGLITFICMLINFFLLPISFPSAFDLDRWCVKKHIVFSMGNILMIALLNWLYNNITGQKLSESIGIDLISFLIITAGVGILPVIILTLVLERQLWKKHSLVAQTISERLEKQKGPIEDDEPISLISESTKESFELPQNCLICIGSEGNYSKVYYRSQGRIEERLIRMPLKKVEELLHKFDKIVRCHRSYIVNLPSIASVSGNARSFKLHMAELDFTIPVSRSFPKAMIEQLKIEQV